jgi:NADH dehydrogenase FAD-containing subunit
LLYQVATASLAPSEIAWLRAMMRGGRETTTLLATVTGVDVAERRVLLDGREHLHRVARTIRERLRDNTAARFARNAPSGSLSASVMLEGMLPSDEALNLSCLA